MIIELLIVLIDVIIGFGVRIIVVVFGSGRVCGNTLSLLLSLALKATVIEIIIVDKYL